LQNEKKHEQERLGIQHIWQIIYTIEILLIQLSLSSTHEIAYNDERVKVTSIQFKDLLQFDLNFILLLMFITGFTSLKWNNMKYNNVSKMFEHVCTQIEP